MDSELCSIVNCWVDLPSITSALFICYLLYWYWYWNELVLWSMVPPLSWLLLLRMGACGGTWHNLSIIFCLPFWLWYAFACCTSLVNNIALIARAAMQQHLLRYRYHQITEILKYVWCLVGPISGDNIYYISNNEHDVLLIYFLSIVHCQSIVHGVYLCHLK